MNIHVLRELKPYSFLELQDMFKKDEKDLKNILNTLSLINIARRLSKDISKIELEELLDTENFYELNLLLEGNVYVFKYVGVLVLGDICLIIYPKYENNYLDDRDNGFKVFNQLISVIRKYKSKEQKIGDSDLESNSNLLSITLELIFSYYEYGLYRNDKKIIELNGDGQILWDKTINENTAYFSNGVPIYLDIFTINQETNENDYFRKLHATVLTTVCKKLKDVLKILNIDMINVSSDSIEDFGNREYITYRINQELSTQFVTYKQNILKLLKKIIEEDYSTASSDNISFVGTNSFNLVWEDVCSVVMGDCINKTMKELGLSYSKNTKQSALISDVIPKPKWTHSVSGISHTSSKTLIPDIITIKDSCLSIYDAKYYKIKLDDKEVKNQPGVGDVTKQYLYELSYKEFANENSLNINTNAFLMPTSDKYEKRIGYASMELFNTLGDIKLNDIEVILKPAEEMYKTYLKNDSI